MRFAGSEKFASVNRFFKNVKQQVLGNPDEPVVDELQVSLTRKLAELRAQHMREGFQAMRGRREAAGSSDITQQLPAILGETIVMSSDDDHFTACARP
jgi:hypothetical protein